MSNKSQSKDGVDAQDSNWQQDVLTKLVFASLDEQKKAHRWSTFFKGIFAGYIFLILFLFMFPGSTKSGSEKNDSHTALIEISGVISADSDANADRIITGLRDAFDNEHVAGIVLRINSPGGSPVQSAYIYDEVIRLRELNPEIKVYAVIMDICASGGYYIASAADEIYANKSSLVGSIGVIMNGFGFVDTLKKLGVERRLYTAGENKGFLDPFSPSNKEQIAHAEKLLKNIHVQFITAVKEGRGSRLKDEARIFSGLIWTGEQGRELGLVDEFGSASFVAREVIKAETIIDYTPRKSIQELFVDSLGVMGSSSTSVESVLQNLNLNRIQLQ